MIRAIWTVMLMLLALALLTASGANAITLADNSRTEYVIVVAENAIPAEKTAAKELRKYLHEVTGADFPIVSESQASRSYSKILLGQSQTVKNLLKGMDWKSLEHDGIIIKTLGSNLVLSGGQPRGTLYAVYTFLEDYVGCKWWTGTESTIPKKPTLAFGQINMTYTPKIKYREAFYLDPLDHPLHAAKLKLNGHMYGIPEEYGSHYTIIGWCHTLYQLLPPEKYFKDHPEWYSFRDGVRKWQDGQPCLTNEEVRKEVTKNALSWIRKNPEAGIISISQNDWHGACLCPECRKVEAEEGGHSGAIIRFVNKVAEEIEKEYPNFLVETLAYSYSRQAPLKVKPRHNVIVRLCSIECIFTEPLEAAVNKPFADDIRTWASISPNLYIWDYTTNFHNCMIPQPNLRVLAPNIRFFEKYNAMGIFEQGDAYCTVGDFVRLKAWLFGHLLWNPQADENKLIKEFIYGYYGAAAPYIEQYVNLVHDACAREHRQLHCYHQDTSYLNFDDLSESVRLFSEAEKAVAKDPVLLKRVQRDRMVTDHVVLLRYDELKAIAAKQNKPFFGPADLQAAAKNWISLAREWKTTHYSESQSFDQYASALRSRVIPVPTLEELNKMSGKDVLVIEEDGLTLFEKGKLTDFVDDSRANNGKSARMSGGHVAWALQYRPTAEMAKKNPGRWRWYLVARAEGAPSGLAFQYGYHTEHRGMNLLHAGDNLTNSGSGAYRVFPLGIYELDPKCYFWSAPYGNGELKGLYIDKLVLVRDSD